MREKTSVLLHQTEEFLRGMRRDLGRNVDRWNQIVGRFGWLSIRLPEPITSAYAAALVASCFLGSSAMRRPAWWQRAVFLVTAAAGVVAVQLMLFVSYDLSWIQGVISSRS
jgi:hypothetical protein